MISGDTGKRPDCTLVLHRGRGPLNHENWPRAMGKFRGIERGQPYHGVGQGFELGPGSSKASRVLMSGEPKPLPWMNLFRPSPFPSRGRDLADRQLEPGLSGRGMRSRSQLPKTSLARFSSAFLHQPPGHVSQEMEGSLGPDWAVNATFATGVSRHAQPSSSGVQ